MLHYAEQAVDYVTRALEVPLEYDSDTLPILDHYLGTVPSDQEAAVDLVASTSGAYFGEVVRRRIGGSWDLTADDPGGWRLILPGGLSLVPAALVLAAIYRDDDVELDTSLQAPPKMQPHLEDALERMGQVTEEVYYSLCGRLDTLEHVQAVLLAIAAHEQEKRRKAN